MVTAPDTKAPQPGVAFSPPTEQATAMGPKAEPSVAGPQSAEAADYPEVLEDEDEFRLEDPVELPRFFPEIQPPPVTAKVAREQKASCPGCGQPLAATTVICAACGYHQRLQRRVDDFDEDEEREAVGFERWLRRRLVDGDDPNAIQSLIALSVAVAAGLGVIVYLIIGHLIWIVIIAAGVLALGAQLGWWKLVPWDWLLFINRMLQWREVTPPFALRPTLDLRNMAITDQELANLQNLNEIAVIDLEGAPITDQGLPTLYNYRNLQFIVLRDTQTTESGVKRLQHALPNAWIWR